jgi:hypothetical protein
MLTTIVLLCSMLSTPGHEMCVRENAIRWEKLGTAPNDFACEVDGMIFAAQHYEVDVATQYVKVLCVRPSRDASMTPG